MITKETLGQIQGIQTPFYYYDMNLLFRTLRALKLVANNYKYTVHYAIKANANTQILQEISSHGFSADCVSGNEIKKAIECGFHKEDIVYAGVGKTDEEIEYAIQTGIFCFNVESVNELSVIDGIAKNCNCNARVSIRINPDLDAHTHDHINTGTEGTKFGIGRSEIDLVIKKIKQSRNIEFVGLHFHVGSQILDLTVFERLASMSSFYVAYFNENGLQVLNLNLGGGLGIDYQNPVENPIPDFSAWFQAISENLDVPKTTKIHLEPGRSVVAQCGTLVTKVLYTKPGVTNSIAITDAGFTDLIRPALYGAYHKIINLSSNNHPDIYDIAGPICECTDYFSKGITLPAITRGDILAVLSAGAYGQVMVSEYNLRKKPGEIYSSVVQPENAEASTMIVFEN